MTIDKDVPIPRCSRRRTLRPDSRAGQLRTLYASEVGDSMLFEIKSSNSLRAAASRIGPLGWYTTRREEAGIRVWKIR